VYVVENFNKNSLGLIFLQGPTIHHLVNKFKTIGSVLDKKIKTRCHILTEETLDIGARLEYLPRKSLAKLAQQADVSVSSVTATKLLKLCHNKITRVYSLQPTDPATRIHFCNWFIQSVSTLHPQLLFLLMKPSSI
jgi:hypothetical protein